MERVNDSSISIRDHVLRHDLTQAACIALTAVPPPSSRARAFDDMTPRSDKNAAPPQAADDHIEPRLTGDGQYLMSPGEM